MQGWLAENFRCKAIWELISLIRLPRYTRKVYTENVKRDEIIMDVEIFYAGDAEISVTLKKMGIPITAGLKNMKVSVED